MKQIILLTMLLLLQLLLPFQSHAGFVMKEAQTNEAHRNTITNKTIAANTLQQSYSPSDISPLPNLLSRYRYHKSEWHGIAAIIPAFRPVHTGRSFAGDTI